MSDSNIEAIMAGFEAQAQIKPGEEMDGIIETVITSTAGDLFGDKAKDPEKQMIEITVKVTSDGSVFKESYSFPKGPASWKNDSFKLGKYRQTYGKVPAVGDKVLVSLDDKGFYRVSVDR
jgi:hypothetical protein